jgi:Polyketide cyclase / dehydrase and lipid transport
LGAEQAAYICAAGGGRSRCCPSPLHRPLRAARPAQHKRGRAATLVSCVRTLVSLVASRPPPPTAHCRYSPEQLYEVVAGVQHYSQFVPWCVGSNVLKRAPDGGYLEAELQIGFQMISERCEHSI